MSGSSLYMAGQGGGGAFVLFYLIFLAILGLPVMTMEFSVDVPARKPCQSLLRSGETGPEMAYPRIYHSDRMLSSDDVLHNRYRLDAELFLYDSYR